MYELEAAPVRIVEIEAFRERGVLDGAAEIAVKRSSPSEDLVEPRVVNVEGDFVRILGDSMLRRGKENQEGVTYPDRAVFAFEFVGTC